VKDIILDHSNPTRIWVYDSRITDEFYEGESFAQEYISDEEVWIGMMDRRNLSSHIYSEWQVREILPRLNIYLQAFEALIEKITGRFGNEEER